ncbi:MAG: hypothetical protein RRZ71_08275 [Clostridia bacterium]
MKKITITSLIPLIIVFMLVLASTAYAIVSAQNRKRIDPDNEDRDNFVNVIEDTKKLMQMESSIIFQYMLKMIFCLRRMDSFI